MGYDHVRTAIVLAICELVESLGQQLEDKLDPCARITYSKGAEVHGHQVNFEVDDGVLESGNSTKTHKHSVPIFLSFTTALQTAAWTFLSRSLLTSLEQVRYL